MVDDLIAQEEIYEIGFFNASSGYAHCRPGVENVFGKGFSLFPYIEMEVHNIVPYERAKVIMREVSKRKGAKLPHPR